MTKLKKTEYTYKRTNPESGELEYLAWFDHGEMMNGECFEMRDTPEEIRLFEEDRQTLWMNSVCWYNPSTVAEFKVPKKGNEKMIVHMYHATKEDTEVHGSFKVQLVLKAKKGSDEEDREIYEITLSDFKYSTCSELQMQVDEIGEIEIPAECKGRKIRVKLSANGADGSWK